MQKEIENQEEIKEFPEQDTFNEEDLYSLAEEEGVINEDEDN